MDNPENSTVACFDKHVDLYDAYQCAVVPEYKTALAVTAMTFHRHVQPNAKFLDLGCGTGNGSVEILKQCPLSRVFLIDGSARMIQRAMQKIHSAVAGAVLGHKAADISQKKWNRDLQTESFDAIISTFVLEHLTFNQYRELLNKCHSLLKSGGWFITVEAYEENGAEMVAWLREQMAEHKCRLPDKEMYTDITAFRDREEMHYYSSKAQKQKWWQDAGLEHVQVVWQYLSLALMAGRKP